MEKIEIGLMKKVKIYTGDRRWESREELRKGQKWEIKTEAAASVRGN